MNATPRRLLPLFALLFLAGCESCDAAGLNAVNPRLLIEPSALDFGDVISGVRAQGSLTLRNEGDARLTLDGVSFDSEPGGFEIVGGFETVIGTGQSIALLVALEREPLGFAEAVLRVASDDPERPVVRVRVTATIVEPPLCNDGNACTADIFDPETNRCTHPFTDGVACVSADRCIVDAVCSQGVCLGSAKVCEDNNPCTSNFCRQTDGSCLFLEEESLCDDDNPCTADSCSPEGCVHEPVPTGIACDDGDLCTQGDACFQGRCTGAGLADGTACDDGDSCTIGDTCSQGECSGESILTNAPEGSVVFTYPLQAWPERAFLHRREVSLADSDVFYGLDHLNLPEGEGLAHVLFAMEQCGSSPFRFTYRPPDANVQVSYVRRAVQVDQQNGLRLVVGVRQRPQDGYRPQTTAYVLDPAGEVQLSQIQRLGGETGRSLLPDGSEVFGVIFPLTEGPPTAEEPALQNLVIVREDVSGAPLWRHERASDDWAEFLGVAGPRVLFWTRGRFGALDFNTGATVWSQETPFTSDEMALSTPLDLGIIRTKPAFTADGGQLIGVEILEGDEVFQFPSVSDPLYFPRAEPVIAANGVIGVLMQRNSMPNVPERLEWVELDASGQILTTTILPYVFPEDFGMTRHEDFRDDPYPTVADDGVTYVGYGRTFYAIEPGGAGLRWTLTSSLSEDAFTGTVPLLRDDGVLLINESSRRLLGIRTNGGRMSQDGWASFRHDGRRTNYTPPASLGPN